MLGRRGPRAKTPWFADVEEGVPPGHAAGGGPSSPVVEGARGRASR